MKDFKREMITLACCLLLLAIVACGGGETKPPSDPAAAGASAVTPATSGETGTPGLKSAPLETARFSTVLPDGWEVMADDLEKMGMMTLAKKGTGGATGVYLKFEGGGNYDGDPMKDVEAFATKQKGTPVETVSLNGIDWAKTAYEAYGTKQAMYVTKSNGTKVTATVMGDETSPEVKAILGAFKLK